MAFGAARDVVSSAARTTTGTSSAIVLADMGRSMNLAVETTAASGTTPTLDLTIEWSDDGGTTWFVTDTSDAFTQITGTGNGLRVKQFLIKAATYRIRWTVAGTTPSFTFAISEYLT